MKGRRNKPKRKRIPKWISLDDVMEALDAEFERMRKTPRRKSGGQRASGPGKKPPKPDSGRKAEQEDANLPNFGKRVAKENYRNAVSLLAKALGAEASQLTSEADEDSHLAGCLSFPVDSRSSEKLVQKHQDRLLKQGVFLFRNERGDPSGKDQVALLPTDDWREVLLGMQTYGGNCDLMPKDVVKWLADLREAQPFRLTGAAHDWCEGEFLQPVKNPRRLAKRMYEFCPDIVHQGVGTVAALAKALSRSQKFFFWWD